MNIIFIGLSGSGKSTFGSYCSQLLDMPLIDTDSHICEKFGDIATIFSNGGEAVFRAIEESVVIEAAAKDNCIVATGGGTVLCTEAMKALKKSGLVVYLNCDSAFIADRLINDKSRPLLMCGDGTIENKLAAMLKERERLYLEYADVVLNESEVLKSRNLLDSSLEDQLGALYLELVLKLERKVYAKI